MATLDVMCAGSSNVKSLSVSLTFASTGRDSCFPAYSLSLSIISVFPVSPLARHQRRYLRDQGISPDRFLPIVDRRSCGFVFADHVLFAPIKTFSWRIISSPVKRLSRRLTISGGHSPVSSIDISLGQSHWPKLNFVIQTAVCEHA